MAVLLLSAIVSLAFWFFATVWWMKSVFAQKLDAWSISNFSGDTQAIMWVITQLGPAVSLALVLLVLCVALASKPSAR